MTTRRSLRPIPSLAVLAAALLVLSACGGGDDAGTQGQGDQLSGAVRIDGSSTVFPITEAVAEEFMKEHPGVRVTVGVSGTGGGFAKFLRNETDLNDASRPIKASEREQSQQGGVAFIELPVAYDGLAVLVNPQNDWATCLTVDELQKIWAPNSQVNRWSQVRAGFPDRPLVLYGPGTDSGTYDYFTEAVNGEEGASRSDFSASEDDNVLVQGIAGDQGALGFFGFAYYGENQDKLKLVGVDDGNPANGEGCILPSEETVRNGTYAPLSRPLLVYVRQASAADPAVKTFVEYYLQHAGTLVPEVGYVPLTEREYQLSLGRFQQGTTGTLFEQGHRVGVTLEELLRLQEGTGAAPDSAAADTVAP